MHEKYMRQALDLARQAAACGEVPVGCVIVKDGRVIGRGRNRREECQAAWSHAEMEAMAQANRALGTWRLDGCTLYVTLEPCPMCAGAILNARVSRVYFGARDREMGACGGVIFAASPVTALHQTAALLASGGSATGPHHCICTRYDII